MEEQHLWSLFILMAETVAFLSRCCHVKNVYLDYCGLLNYTEKDCVMHESLQLIFFSFVIVFLFTFPFY